MNNAPGDFIKTHYTKQTSWCDYQFAIMFLLLLQLAIRFNATNRTQENLRTYLTKKRYLCSC